MQSHTRIALSIPVAMVLVWGCSPPPPQVQMEIRSPVEVDTVELGDVESVIVATGNLYAQASAKVNAQVSGRIFLTRDENGRRLSEGDSVQAGDVLAQVTGIEARLNIGLESALLQFENAQSELTRKTRLFEDGHIPESEIQQAKSAFEQARLAYQRAMLSEENTQVTTPIDGIILKLPRDQENVPIADGQLISSGLQIAEIASLDVLEAYVDLIGPELSRVEKGQEARITHYAFSDMSIRGHVKGLSPTVDRQTRTFQAVIEVENFDHVLRPGMFVQVEIIIEQRLQVPVVHYESISRQNRESVVFVLDGQRVKATKVELGLADDELQEVIEGVSPGDRVVVGGLEILSDGVRVRVLGD